MQCTRAEQKGSRQGWKILGWIGATARTPEIRASELAQDLHGDSTTNSPTIISKTQILNFKQNIEFHPLARHYFEHFKRFSEIIVGDFVVKSPYEISLSF